MSTDDIKQQRLIIVSGLSGAGKSVALRTLEDIGFYCVDNLPAQMLPQFLETFSSNELTRNMPLAVGIDVRSHYGHTSDLAATIEGLRHSALDMRVAFFDCDVDVLIQRFADTRRRHPLSVTGLPLREAIHMERSVLQPVRAVADVVFDTSHHNVHRLRRDILAEFSSNSDGNVTLLFESFAYRKGLPGEADLVFDARALTNPYWNTELRAFTGRDARVAAFLDEQADVQLFVEQVGTFLDTWLPKLATDSTRSYITVAFGCSGGKHRSVYLAERFAARARDAGWSDVVTNHREHE